MKRGGICVHYSGTTTSDHCAAGVRYADLAGDAPGMFFRLPCVATHVATHAAATWCEHRREPTAEELAEEDAKFQARFDCIGKVREAIVAACGGPWKKGSPGVRGTIQCPCCSHVVNFTRASTNGHIHAACSNPECVRWME